MTHPIPAIKENAPELKISCVGGGTWDLSKSKANKFSLVVFYRGAHCPICKKYLKDLHSKIGEFKKLGVDDIIAISGDSLEMAEKCSKEWEIPNLKIGHDQSVESMKNWGLYISQSIKDEEPKTFGEPGVFLVHPYKQLFYAAINSMPFARPQFSDLIDGIKVIFDKDYPARGTVAYSNV